MLPRKTQHLGGGGNRGHHKLLEHSHQCLHVAIHLRSHILHVPHLVFEIFDSIL